MIFSFSGFFFFRNYEKNVVYMRIQKVHKGVGFMYEYSLTFTPCKTVIKLYMRLLQYFLQIVINNFLFLLFW